MRFTPETLPDRALWTCMVKDVFLEAIGLGHRCALGFVGLLGHTEELTDA